MNKSAADHSTHSPPRAKVAGRYWALTRQCLLTVALAMACQSALAQAMYRIKPLGYLGGCTTYAPSASGLNAADHVTGQACNANGDLHAFLWKNDGTSMIDLGPEELGSTSNGSGINASGLVAGDAQDSTGSFAFESSGNGKPMQRIYDAMGGGYVAVTAMNDLGQLTGYAYTAGDTAYHAFVWKNDGTPMSDLGTLGGSLSVAFDINASGQVAGQSDLAASGVKHAFVWKNDGTPMHDLGTLGGKFSGALGINAAGQVAGTSTLSGTNQRPHAFFWRNDGTPMQDLGTLGGVNSTVNAVNDSGQFAGALGTRVPYNYQAFVLLNNGTPVKNLGTFGGIEATSNDINSSGQVTGWAALPDETLHAFLWKNDGTKIQDVNKLIDPTDPLKPYVTLTSGEFINDSGDIVATGTDSRTGLQGEYLLQGTVLTLSSRSLAFGNQRINTKSAAKSVTLTNTSPKVVAITSIALTGSGSGQFALTNNCGSSMVGHATCTIKITFKPTTKGAKSAALNVNGGGGGLRVVNLTGTGT